MSTSNLTSISGSLDGTSPDDQLAHAAADQQASASDLPADSADDQSASPTDGRQADSADDQPASAIDDPVFVQEQEHLSRTHAKLQELERVTSERLEANLREIQDFKGNMSDELSSDMDAHDVTMETYAAYAVLNNVIDEYNISVDVDAENLARLRRLLVHPYFAKITLQFPDRSEPRDLYLGATGVSDERHHQLVVDWRSPVAETYYNQQSGPMTYEANGRTVHVDLKARRQFETEGARLLAYFDTTVAIQDPMLLASLSQRRSSQLTAITATIQREQNEVVRYPDVPVLLVRGVAGSGKTSVMLQRIAYLLYQNRTTLNAQQVVLVTPNPVFERYIWNVLPELGEKNPRTKRWAQLMDQLGPGDRATGSDISPESLRSLQQAVGDLRLDEEDVREVRAGQRVLLSARQVWGVVQRYLRKVPVGPRLVTLVEESLLTKLEARLERLAGSESVQAELWDLDADQQDDIFGGPIQPTDDLSELRRLTRTYLDATSKTAFEQVESGNWLRIDRIGMRMLGKESLSAVEWVWLKVVLAGKADDDARYVMVDEVQDYTEAQIMVLAHYYRRAHFLLLGDPNQAIRPGTASFDRIRTVFEEARGSDAVYECVLETSYRSTPQVTSLFARLADKDDGMVPASVQRPGEEPRLLECPGRDSDPDAAGYRKVLADLVRELAGREGLSAVVVGSRSRLHWLGEALRHDMEEDAPRVIGEGDSLPDSGVVMLTLDLAKGLEFDHVVVADAQEQEFSDDPLSRRRLYTAISRATKTVAVVSQGAMTHLLS